ncbi:hypothetical protein JZ751_003499, partial [Albula glossodonta]
MRDWIISKAQSIPREKFQMEPIQTDGLIHLAWEVNMRLKLQNICRDLGLSLSSPPALSDLETQQAALSDLACPPAVTAPARFSSFYFDPQPVVERAVREIIEELTHPPTSRLHTVAEVVMDTVADLSCALLEELESVEQCEVQRWPKVRPRLVGALCGGAAGNVSQRPAEALRGKLQTETAADAAAEAEELETVLVD